MATLYAQTKPTYKYVGFLVIIPSPYYSVAVALYRV